MATEKLVLTFPASRVKERTISHFVRAFDLEVNIMKASISPDELGHMVVELEGALDRIDAAKAFMDERGIQWEALISDVRRIDENCTHCTACVTVCPSAALRVERPSMLVSFAGEKCIGCELCIPVCMYKAMEMSF